MIIMSLEICKQENAIIKLQGTSSIVVSTYLQMSMKSWRTLGLKASKSLKIITTGGCCGSSLSGELRFFPGVMDFWNTGEKKSFQVIKLLLYTLHPVHQLCFMVPPLLLYCTNHRVYWGSSAHSCGAEHWSAQPPPLPHHPQSHQYPLISPGSSSSNASMLKW